MGGSFSQPAIASPSSSYTSNMLGALRLSSGTTSQLANTAPTLRSVDVRALQNMTRGESLLNALASQDVESKVSPDTLAVRNLLPAQVREDLEGGPSQALSNQWLKMGLNDVIATGAMTDSGFARSALADSTRRDYYDTRTAQQAKAAALLSANPAPVAGLDPGMLATTVQSTKNANADATDAWRNAVLASGQVDNNNLINAMQQSAQRWGQYENDLASATNAARASKGSFWGGALSGAAAGASAGSMAGPYGTAIGGILGAVGGGLASR
ncbi:MAG: hypothetical protein WC069_06455 [Candidatus Shapirobacteria bacterium]|nr:hypothetical protein [Terrimicrobiaceae bacterium]